MIIISKSATITLGRGSNIKMSSAMGSLVPPFIGRNTVGGTVSGEIATSTFFGCKFLANSSFTTSRIWCYMNHNDATVNFRVAIYSDNSGVPTNKLAESGGTGTYDATPAWRSCNIAYSIVQGTTYWLSAWGEDNVFYYYDAGTSNQTFHMDGVTFPTWTDPLSGQSYLDRNISIYAE